MDAIKKRLRSFLFVCRFFFPREARSGSNKKRAINRGRFYNTDIFVSCVMLSVSSVADPKHFGTDPDPRNCIYFHCFTAPDPRIRILFN